MGLELISVTESVYFKLQSFFLVITENWVRNSSNFFAISGVVGFRRTDKHFSGKLTGFFIAIPLKVCLATISRRTAQDLEHRL